MASLRLLTPQDESMILEWRNSDAVAPYMLRDTLISQEDHHHWFGGILIDTDRALFRVMEHEGIPCGFVSLSRIDVQECSCEWGGYLSPHVPRGAELGRTLMYLSIMIAFDQLGLHQIVVEVIIDNNAAMKLYASMGFVWCETKINRAERKHGPVDVFMMSLQRDDWNSLKDDLESRLIMRNLISE